SGSFSAGEPSPWLTAKAWFNEVYTIEVPKGRYTLEIEKDGYPKKHMEVLVTDNTDKPFLIVMGEEDNVIKYEP
ncbi:MAG: hypothetical protein J6N53_01915, partial [Lachnospiraceae bacterium]|nr:hypothetical protein [Lachnospiraceae bacterium]